MGKKSKTKGRRFEIDIARKFGKWIGDEQAVWHTHSSGAMGHTVSTQVGDICPQQGYAVTGWKLCIEIKKREEWTFDQLMQGNKKAPIREYWKQVNRDSRRFPDKPKIPLLIISKNRSRTFLLFSSSSCKKFPCLTTIPLQLQIYLGRPTHLSVVLLEDFFSTISANDLGIVLV